jgi:hypothetical protein
MGMEKGQKKLSRRGREKRQDEKRIRRTNKNIIK